jgi:hypothetical protein
MPPTNIVAAKPILEMRILLRDQIFEALGSREEATADFRHALSKVPDLHETKDGLKRLGANP